MNVSLLLTLRACGLVPAVPTTHAFFAEVLLASFRALALVQLVRKRHTSYSSLAPIRLSTSYLLPLASTTTAEAAPTKGAHELTATPSAPTKKPRVVAFIVPFLSNVVSVNTALAAFFTAEGCAHDRVVAIRAHNIIMVRFIVLL